MKKINLFLQHIMVERLSFEEENIVKDIQNLFRLDKKLRQLKIQYLEINIGVTIILNMKLMVTEIKHYHLKNILIKLDHF